MNKFINIKKYLVLLILLFPLNVRAFEGNVTIDCDKTTALPGDTISCGLKGTVTGDGVSTVDLKITSSDSELLTLETVKISSPWGGDGLEGVVGIYSEVDLTGTFDIATFTLKVNDNVVNGNDVKINVTDIVFYNGAFGGGLEKIELNSVEKNIRIASTVNTLSSLEIEGAELSPVFSENTFSYSSTIDAKEITIKATTKDSKSQLKGDLGTLKLNYGINNFAINVTSEAGVTKVYSITVNRPDNRDTDNTLKTLKINGTDIKIEKNKFEYSYDVENNITETDIIATLNSEFAILTEGTLDRKIKLSEGKNKIEFKVMAENEKIATYTIIINRKTKTGITTNPKTGSGTIWIVIGVLIISIAIGVCSYEYYKKKVRKNNEEK